MAVKPIPDGYHSITPYLIVQGGAAALDYYTQVFDAKELVRMPGPDGRIMHAEIKIGDSLVMLADEVPETDVRGPKSIGGTPICLLVYVADVDKVFDRAIAAGGKATKPVQNQFYGDRSGVVEDPFGHNWNIATHIEDVSPEEMQRRIASMKK